MILTMRQVIRQALHTRKVGGKLGAIYNPTKISVHVCLMTGNGHQTHLARHNGACGMLRPRQRQWRSCMSIECEGI